MGNLAMPVYCMTFAIIMSFFTFHVANAYDPSPLQDFCVGVTDPHSAVFVNGLFCKNPKDVTTDDFLYKHFDKVRDTRNKLGSKAIQVNSTTLPALNTLGVSMGRVDIAPGGLNPPHYHPRGSEMFTVLHGTLYAGFVTSNFEAGGNRLFSKVVTEGDIFVIPRGLIHFQLNIGDTPAVLIVAFSSQSPGLVTVANAVFGSTPHIFNDVLTKGFQVNDEVIGALQSQFSSNGEYPSNYYAI